mmetsp:Transcript_14766/g.36840  ORF Transcript_14766/g.36840 Transcript_14766/m.36840 type:complete len:172 (-) Transcript_14766:473-988(-)
MAQQKDLLDVIDFNSSEVLNSKNANAGLNNCLKQGYRDQDELYLESDADEQLLLNIAFQQKVKLMAIGIKGPAEGGPRRVKLYVNRSHMGFSDVQGDVPPAQELDLTPAQIASGDPIPLKLVKFAFVNNLSIFVEDNQEGSEDTKVSKIVIFGSAGEVFDVAQIKKIDDKS